MESTTTYQDSGGEHGPAAVGRLRAHLAEDGATRDQLLHWIARSGLTLRGLPASPDAYEILHDALEDPHDLP